MPDYISREWLLDLYDDSKLTEKEKSYGVPFNIVRQNIIDAPAVDAVPVVRCQNCKYYALWADGRSMNRCDKHECTMCDEDFCSYGEPKEG